MVGRGTTGAARFKSSIFSNSVCETSTAAALIVWMLAVQDGQGQLGGGDTEHDG